MEKASRILIKIGDILAILIVVAMVLLTVLFFFISAPSNIQIIIDGIIKGTIVVNIEGSVEEKAYFVQHIFLILAIVFIFVSLIGIATNVFNFFINRLQYEKYRIFAFIFNILIINIPSIVGYIFYYIVNKNEVCDLGDKSY